MPPSNRPEFAEWEVVKDDAGKVLGMRCPRCRAVDPERASAEA
jgi:uncharacterized C2H2 Zn-finger protein